MSDIASQSLCLELYELTGWDDFDEDAPEDMQWYMQQINEADEKVAPMYTLSYLLRKLPPKRVKMRNFGNGCWSIQYNEDYKVKEQTVSGRIATLKNTREHNAEADNPEDAVARLCIILAGRGIVA